MAGLNLQKLVAQEATVPYWNNLFSNNFPSDSEYAGASFEVQKIQKEHKFTFCNTTTVYQEDQHDHISYWHEGQDSFTQKDLLNNEEEQVQELIYQIRKSFSIRYHDKLANRLLALFKYEKEDDPACLGIAVGSLRNFYHFFRLNINIECPTISLTPDYNIYASWRGEQHRVFSVHFLPNRDARFVIFKPNDRYPERKLRLSGTVTTDVLMETVAPYNIYDWILE